MRTKKEYKQMIERLERVKVKSREAQKAVAGALALAKQRYIELILIGLLALVLGLAGCNTINGVGRDLQSWSSQGTTAQK